MDRKSLSHIEFKDIIQEIEAILTKAGLPKGSVEIKFKSTDKFDIESLRANKLTEQFPEWKCGGCGGGGMIGFCCEW